jgi:site-specific recombinase XerC
MRNLNRDFKLMCQRNRDGSFATQKDRERMLTMVANQLHEGGFKNLRAQGLRTKHIEHLVGRWQTEGASNGTLKNRMSALRWVAEKLGKENIVARDNAAYGIADRKFVTNESKAKALDTGKLARVTDACTAMSLQLQEAFGRRREESIKIQLGWADRGDTLVLKASWTKGGKEREIPIRNEAQRELLNQAKALGQTNGGTRSLIPSDLRYVDQLNRFKAQTAFAGHRPGSWPAPCVCASPLS